MAEEQFQIGDRVSLTNSANKDQEGMVRFLGQLEGKEGTWCGIELNIPKGTHSGEFNGKKYFECKENHGLFVREKHLMLLKRDVVLPQQVEPASAEKQAPAATAPPLEKKPVVKPPVSSTTKPTMAGVASTLKTVTKVVSSADKSSTTSKAATTNNQTSSSTSSTANKKDSEQLLQRELEINQLKEELERKEELLADLTNTISELQDKVDVKELAFTKQEDTIRDLESKLSSEKQHIQTLNKDLLSKEDQLAKAIEDIDLLQEALKDSEDATSLAEQLTIAKENLEHKLEEVKRELAIHIAENKKLNDEKEIAQMELEEAMAGAVSESSSSAGGANDELIKNNARLRHAVQVLNDQLDMEKIESLEKIIDLEGKIERLPELETTITDLQKKIDSMNVDLRQKKDEIEDLKETLEIHAESVDMVERLTEQKQELEEKIMSQKIEIKELKEFKKINDELIIGYEESNTDLQNEITSLEYQLYEQKRLVQEKEEQLHDSEKIIESLRQRAKSLKDQSDSYKLEASSTENAQSTTAGKAVSDIQKLLEQQQELFAEKRIIYKKYIESNITRINGVVENECKQNVYVESIPDSIRSRINIDGLKQLITTQRNRRKAQLLLQELLFYLDRQSQALIQQENLAVFTWVDSLMNHLNKFINHLTRFEAQLISAHNESDLTELTKNVHYQSVVAGGMFVDSVLKQLMDDNLSPKISLDPITTANNKISEDEKSQTKPKQNLKSDVESRLTIEHTVEQVRLTLNSLIFKSKFYASSSSSTSISNNGGAESTPSNRNTDMLFNTLQKRITEFLAYFYSFPVCSFNLALNTLKLTRLLELSQTLCTTVSSIPKERGYAYLIPLKTELKEDLDEKEQSAEEKEEKENIAAFRRLITETANLLSNLNTEIDQKLQQTQGIQENEFTANKQTYWATVIEKTRNDLDGISKTIENEKKLSEELTGSIKTVVQLEKTLEDINKIKASLEQRVVQLQITSERVSGLENEKKRFAEKEKSFKEATDLIQKELDNNKKKYKDALEEIKNLKNPQNGLTVSQNLTTSQASRTSLTNRFQPNLSLRNTISSSSTAAEPPVLNHARSIVVPSEVDNYDLVRIYENENNILRSIQLKDRLRKLTDEPSNLKAMKLLKEKKPESDLSFLVSSVKKIEDIHQKGLSVLVSKQIIDLSTLSSSNLAQKDQNITKHLQTNNNQIEALRFEAYKICNALSQKVSKNPSSYKQRFELPANGAGPQSELLKLGSVILNPNGEANASAAGTTAATTKLTVSLEDWRRIKEIF